MAPLSTQTAVTGDVAVISLIGELDVAGSAILDGEFDRVINEHDPRGMVLDLSSLTFMDSCGLRMVLLGEARARVDERMFALVAGTVEVQRVFDITGIGGRLLFFGSVDEAVHVVASG